MRPVLAAGLSVVLVAAACGSDPAPGPPPNAGTLVVHAQFKAGACNRANVCALDYPMQGVEVVVDDAEGHPTTARADEHGDAHFALSPGRYHAALAENVADTCGAGATDVAAVVSAHSLHRVGVECDDP